MAGMEQLEIHSRVRAMPDFLHGVERFTDGAILVLPGPVD